MKGHKARPFKILLSFTALSSPNVTLGLCLAKGPLFRARRPGSPRLKRGLAKDRHRISAPHMFSQTADVPHSVEVGERKLFSLWSFGASVDFAVAIPRVQEQTARRYQLNLVGVNPWVMPAALLNARCRPAISATQAAALVGSQEAGYLSAMTTSAPLSQHKIPGEANNPPRMCTYVENPRYS